MTEWNWSTNPYRPDPVTQRKICVLCWFGTHGNSDTPCCQQHGCRCVCRERGIVEVQVNQHRRDARKAKKKLMREMLEQSPLKADNPNFDKRVDVG